MNTHNYFYSHNDIQNCSKIVSIILFADDTNIFYSHNCLKELNDIMQTEIHKWLNANKLSINTIKTEFMLFRPLKKNKNTT